MTDRDLSPRDGVSRWLNHQRMDLSNATVRCYRDQLRLFTDWCESENIESLGDLSGWDLDSYQVHRREHAKPITLKKELGTLKRFIQYCESIDAAEDGLAETIQIPTTSKQEDVDDRRLPQDRAKALLEYYREFEPASRRHAVLCLLWFTGARMTAVRGLDLDDYYGEEQYVRFRHRPELDLPLKNGVDGERAVALPDRAVETIDAYLDGPRLDALDDDGLQPLITTNQGRPSRTSMRRWCYRATQPCVHTACPHDEDPETCAHRQSGNEYGCPSSRSPHQIRTGSITWQLNRGVPKETVSERSNVSVRVLEKHYDQEDPVAEMEERRREFAERLDFDTDQ